MLKLSGEALCGKGKFGIDVAAGEYIAQEIKRAHDLGVEIVIVIGGGNFIRGEKLSQLGIERPTADAMGMLGTIINALALQSALEQHRLHTRIMSALTVVQIAEPYTRRRAVEHIAQGRIVLCAGGTGNPYFTTDTAAALRASEMRAEVILKATNVRGVYDSDPNTNNHARFLPSIDSRDMVRHNLRVMDLTAATLSLESGMPIVVFDIFKKGNLKRLLLGQKIGSAIHPPKV